MAQPDHCSMAECAVRLLIVDDEPESIALLLSYLEEQAFDIMVALDGSDGLTKARLGRPNLILLDVSMPGLDGFAVGRLLQEDLRTRHIPIIFLSARTGIEDKLKGFAAGGIDYITKPFSEAEVLARVKIHVGMRQRMESLEAAAGQRLMEGEGMPSDPEEALFGKAAALLEQRLATPPGLVELAHALGTNERKLTLAFRRKVGMSVFEYLAELRLETARRLLEAGSMQIQLIADRVGYRNAGDFTRAFRRRHGISPREYRRALGKEEREAS